MQSQIVHALSQMGITPMAQRVTMTSSMIAGRLALFQKNWECISNDPWVINCILGYAIDFAQTPYQQHPPKELTFPHEEELSLDSEVQKMLDKHAIQLIPSNQANKGFHSQLFTVPKKDGGTRPIINLKKLNSFVQTVHFKMEGTYMLRDLLKTGDWMTKSGPEGRLLHGTHHAPPQEITPFQVARTDISVQLPAIRSVVSSLGLYQDHSPGYRDPQDTGPEDHNLHRRHSDHGRDSNVSERTHSDLSPGEPGVHHKLPQIGPYANTRPRISGIHNRLL